MRVLFWTDWFVPSIGGVEVFSARLLPALARRGHEIVVVAGHHRSGLPDATTLEGVKILRFPFHQVLAARHVDRMGAILEQIASLKRELAPDLVHLNTLGPSVLYHLETVRACEAPVLLTMHSPVMPDATRADTLYGRALRTATWVNCNSQAVRAELCRLLPELSDRSSVTYYGMEPPALTAAPRARHEPRVLVFGRLVPEKGFDIAIHAFAVVAASIPGARLVVVGEGPERQALERLAATLGLSSIVEFVGPVPPSAVPRLLNTVSVVAVPSRWDEPFGLVALEAALMARPVVAARVGGLPEVVEDGRTGLLVERQDPHALAEALVCLLRDPAAADRMGVVARARASALFGWDRCVNEYERLYERSALARV